MDQAKQLKEFEQECGELKRLIATRSLDNLVLQDFACGSTTNGQAYIASAPYRCSFKEIFSLRIWSNFRRAIHCQWFT